MKNIMFISTTSQTGGGPRHLLNLLERLDHSKYRLYVATPRDGEYYDRFAGFAEVIECDIRHHYIRNLFMLKRSIQEHGISLVHSHGRAAGVYSRPLKMLIPEIKVVHTFHGIHYEKKPLPVQWMIKVGERFLKKFTDAAICVSEGEKAEALRLGFADPTIARTIYNGIDADRFHISVDTENYRKRIGLDGSDYVIGCIARLDRVKGHDDLMEAFRLFEKDVSSAKLVLVGDGPEKEALLECVKRCGLDKKVIFTGTRDDIPELLKCFDLFVLASYKEALGYTPIEAMAAGVPVIVTDVPGLTEVVKDHVNGRVCPAHDPQALYETMLSVKEDPDRSVYVKNGFLTVREKFSIDEMIDKISDIYEQFL